VSAPVDYIVTALLVCVGAMLGNVRRPSTEAGWSEPPTLWAVLVGTPSSSKSPAVGCPFDLVRQAEDLLAAGYEEDLRIHELAKQITEAKRDVWQQEVKQAVKNGGIAPPLPRDAVTPDPPVRPRICVADVTTEKAASLAAGLPRGFLIVRDELAGWLGSFDRYGGGGSDRAFAIEMYGGRSFTVDRMKSPEPVRIPHLSIGILGGIQPDKLPAIISGPDDGLASRMLFCWPEALPDFRLARFNVDNREAQNAIVSLTTLDMDVNELGQPKPKVLLLEPEAFDRLEQFAREVHRKSQEASGLLAGTLGKARGHALRLSCVLEYLWWCCTPKAPEPVRISSKAVTAAAALLQSYFVNMAERTFGDASIPARERAAMTLARYLKRKKLFSFNARDVGRTIGGDLRKAEAMNEACSTLEEAGLIRSKVKSSGRPGRKPSNYEVNPRLHHEGAE
jgi:hypothetical protein